MADSYIKRLINAFEDRSDKIAMRIVGDESEVYTYGDSLASIRSVAYRLSQEGIGKGDRVALIGENHPCWALAYLGTLYNGSVCVPLDPHGEIETITNFLGNSEAKIIFISPDMTGKIREIEEKMGRDLPTVVWAMEQPPDGFQKFEDWSSTTFPESFAAVMPDIQNDDNALLMYTSGTTGTPKGVPLTHGNIIAELIGVDDVLKFGPDERILSLLPLFHAYLQIVNLWVATTVGAEVGYLKELSPAELSEAMKSFKPTILTTVPRLWYLFHKKIFDAVEAKPKVVQALFRTMLAANGAARNALGIDLGKTFFGKVHESFGGELRVAISAGSRFDEEVATDFHKLGFTIIQGYGLTETSGAATATFEDDNRVGSVGKPMRGNEIKIADPDKDGVGEVLIRGGVVFKGYYQNEAASAEAFTEDGWFRSGDLGRLDSDGHLYIVGRGKDVIVLPSGKNIHPEDLEVHYLKSPMVEELAIIGVEDESESRAGAEKLAAVIVPDFEYLRIAKIANSKEAVRHDLDNLGRQLPEYQRVRNYIIRAEPLPRTATRKIKRFQLKKEIETGVIAADANEPKAWAFSDEDTALLGSNPAKAVVEAIKNNSRDAAVVHPRMNLEIDLGLDSLARAETFAALEQAYGTEFEGDEAASALTVRDVIDLIERHGGGDGKQVSVDLNWNRILNEADEVPPEVRSVIAEKPLFSVFAFIVYRVFHLFCRVFMLLDVKGLDELKQLKKPYLVCPNHQSFLDPFVLCSSYPYHVFKNVFHVGASEFFEGSFLRAVARLLNVVPVNPDTELMRAMKAGAVGLKHGRILNIYPEGERAFDGDLHDFKKGAAILATELDLPIVPVALDGLHKVWARKSWKIRPAKVKVRIGTPFYAKDIPVADPANDGSPDADAHYAAVTAHLKKTIGQMIAEMRS